MKPLRFLIILLILSISAMKFPVILWNQNPLAMKRIAFILAILMFPAVLTCEAQSQSPQKALKTVQKENKGVKLVK